ncbi:hypothetical protein DMENIID0001_101750 [Sergentomyia squamirostris]
MKLRLKSTPWWRRYSINSTVHGIKYLVDDDLHPAERIAWLAVVSLAVFGLVYSSLLLSRRFSSSPLATVIESTIYPVSEIPYPAVTICTGNRINWSHVNHVAERYLNKSSNLQRMKETLKYFLASAVERILGDEFHVVEKFREMSNQSHRELEQVNIGELLQDVAPRCMEIFHEICWWRNKYLNCCSIFTVQFSTYGPCLSFNSRTGADAPRRSKESDWPWRTSNYGDWSGLRFTMKSPAGVWVIVHHPVQWPQTAKFIATGSTTTFTITPTFTYSSSSVGRFPPAQRGCLLQREISDENVMSLPGLIYHLENCIGECRQRYMMQYCNCSVDFIYPTGSYAVCNATGIRCIGEFAGQLRHDFVTGHKFDDAPAAANTTTLCPMCLPQCRQVTYGIACESNPLPFENRDLITVDIHFRQATMVKYRTYVVYELLDLIAVHRSTIHSYADAGYFYVPRHMLYMSNLLALVDG